MSQQVIQSTTRRGISTRSVVLVILLVGLGAGAVGYGLNNAFAATNPTPQTTTTNGQQWAGLKGPPSWDHDGSSTLASGWTNPTTVTLTLTGTGSLTTTMRAQALIVPLTS